MNILKSGWSRWFTTVTHLTVEYTTGVKRTATVTYLRPGACTLSVYDHGRTAERGYYHVPLATEEFFAGGAKAAMAEAERRLGLTKPATPPQGKPHSMDGTPA